MLSFILPTTNEKLNALLEHLFYRQVPQKDKSTQNKYENIVNVDFEIHKSATDEVWQRYESAILTISYELFKRNIGTWSGRETAMGNGAEYPRTNYYYVLESEAESAKKIAEDIIQNFNLKTFTRLRVSESIQSTKDFKKYFENEDKLSWVYFKD